MQLRFLRRGFLRPPFFVSSEEDVFDNLLKFITQVVAAVDNLDKAARAFAASDIRRLKLAAKKVSEDEMAADDVRRIIEKILFEGRFFDREEKIDMIEKIDDVADDAEMAAQMMLFKKISVPKELGEILIELTNSTKKTVLAMRNAVVHLYTNFAVVPQYVHIIEEERERVRKFHGQFISGLYSSDLPAAALLLLRDIVFRIMRTADSAEEVGDVTSFMAVKYG